MEARIAAAAGLKFAAIKAGKFRRHHLSNALTKVINVRTLGPNTRDAFRTVQGVTASLKILRKFKPDVIFLKGGYVSLPVGLAAHLLRIPFVIHESDISPGLSNQILSRWATKIAVGFPVKNYAGFDAARLVFTGNPVRPELFSAHRLEGLAAFKLTADLPVIFVTGGSQGAAQINDALLDALPKLLPKYQVIHQTGENDYERVSFKLRRMTRRVDELDHYHPYAFIQQDMPMALAVADVIVGRAGASTIAEAAALGKPTVLIPNYEMAGHQIENARVLSRVGAARVIDGERLTPELLAGELHRILDSAEEQRMLSKAIREFSRPDAAMELAKLVMASARVGEGPAPEEELA